MNPHLDTFQDHQTRAIALLDAVLGRIERDMSEVDVVRLVEELSGSFEFDRQFHAPEVFIGGYPPPRIFRPSGSKRVTPGCNVTVQIAPGTEHAFGNSGASFTFGAEEHPVITQARETLRGTIGFASRWKCTGELYVFARTWTNTRQSQLATGERAIGHVALPPEGWVASSYPRSAWYATLMRRYQVEFLNYRRMDGFYTLRPAVQIRDQCASFGEMIYIDAENGDKIVLGRPGGLDEIGTFSSLERLQSAA